MEKGCDLLKRGAVPFAIYFILLKKNIFQLSLNKRFTLKGIKSLVRVFLNLLVVIHNFVKLPVCEFTFDL